VFKWESYLIADSYFMTLLADIAISFTPGAMLSESARLPCIALILAGTTSKSSGVRAKSDGIFAAEIETASPNINMRILEKNAPR